MWMIFKNLSKLLNSVPKYELVDQPDNENWAMIISSGKYKGVKFQFLTVKVIEIAEKNICKIEYEYDIIDYGSNIHLSHGDAEFENTISKILENLVNDKEKK